MTYDVKFKALIKLHFMKFVIGYPDELLRDENIDDYYANLTVDRADLLKTVLHFNLFDLTDVVRT